MKLKILIIVLIIIALVIVSIIVTKKVKKRIDISRANKAFEESGITGTVAGVPYAFNGATVASQVYQDLHGYPWEYEQDAITAINNVPKQFMKSVSDAYMTMYKLNLLEDVQKYFDAGNFDKVRSQFM